MGLTRRQLLAAAAAGAGRAAAQAQYKAGGAKPRTKPPVCLYSKQLAKVEYDELGKVLRDLGFDGCDLSVEPGGHVLPEHAQADLVRAVLAVTDVGLDVPMFTTSITSPADPNIRLILGIGGFMGVPLFRPGVWKYNGTSAIEARLAQVQGEIAGLAAVGRAAAWRWASATSPATTWAAPYGTPTSSFAAWTRSGWATISTPARPPPREAWTAGGWRCAWRCRG